MYNLFGLSDDDSMFNNDETTYPSNDENEDIGTRRDSGKDIQIVECKYDADQGPMLGMRFLNIDFLYEFYKEHARLKGFNIIKRSVRNDGNNVLHAIKGGKAKESRIDK